MGSIKLSDVDLAASVARLTPGQRECLDLVDDHATSKEIARHLGISRHTVDARLRGAIQTLGVSSRREAAIIYRTAVQAQTQTYQPFAYQSAQLADLPDQSPKASPDTEIEAFGADKSFALDSQMEPSFDEDKILMANLAKQSAPRMDGASDHVADVATWGAPSDLDLGTSHGNMRLWGGVNDLSPGQRMFGILIVMILSMLAFGMFLSGIQALVLLRT